MACKTDPGTTHYSGCDCHEENWVKRLDMERAEIQSLRLELQRSQMLIKIADLLITNENAKEDWENAKRMRHM